LNENGGHEGSLGWKKLVEVLAFPPLLRKDGAPSAG
jgi:hypothetical protein